MTMKPSQVASYKAQLPVSGALLQYTANPKAPKRSRTNAFKRQFNKKGSHSNHKLSAHRQQIKRDVEFLLNMNQKMKAKKRKQSLPLGGARTYRGGAQNGLSHKRKLQFYNQGGVRRRTYRKSTGGY